MRRIALSIQINRPPEDVFDFLSNPTNLAQWQSVMEAANWTPDDVPGVGSTYRVLAKMPGGTREGLFEITRWDPPNQCGYRSVEIAFPIKAIDSVISLAPEGDGTQVTFEARFALAGVLSLAEGMFVKVAERGDMANLATAKRLLEAGGTGPIGTASPA